VKETVVICDVCKQTIDGTPASVKVWVPGMSKRGILIDGIEYDVCRGCMDKINSVLEPKEVIRKRAK
jgi:hypothetical protein